MRIERRQQQQQCMPIEMPPVSSLYIRRVVMTLLCVAIVLSIYWQSIHISLKQDKPTVAAVKEYIDNIEHLPNNVNITTCPMNCPSRYLLNHNKYICCNKNRCSKAIADCPPPYGICQQCSVKILSKINQTVPKPDPMGHETCAMPTTARVGGSSSNIGNDMSAYWHVTRLGTHHRGDLRNLQALGVAAVTGQSFSAQASMGGSTFTGYLPNQWHPPDGWFGDSEKAAHACDCKRPEFPHECIGAWSEVRGLIQDFVHDALTRAGLAQQVQDDILPNEVFVHQRCAWETLLLHRMYGPMSFSVFRQAVKSTTTRVTFIEGKAGDPWLCVKIRESIQEYIRKDHQNITYRVLIGDTNPQSISLDFARLVYAPILVRGPSSFNLWAALANRGQVYSPPNPESWGWTTVELGSDWHWVTTARVLTRNVAKEELKLKRPLEKKPRKDGEPTWTDIFLERALPWLEEDPRWFKHVNK